MAMFGFVYAWYLMAVLLLEIWFVHRTDMIAWAEQEKGVMRFIHRTLALYSRRDTGERSVAFDHKALKVITIVGIPSAFLLHGYVGFIFGSIKANPWWSSVLIPIVFLFSAIVSGIALVILLYMIITPLTGGKINMRCVDKAVDFLFYAVIVDFSLELVDFIHRVYQSEEEIKILSEMVMSKLFASLVIIQVLLGMLVPLLLISLTKIFKKRFSLNEDLRKMVYFISVILIQFGIFATRWNVVIGGQMFSKSFRGLTTYKMEFGGIEGLLYAIAAARPADRHPGRPPEGPAAVERGPRRGRRRGRGGRGLLTSNGAGGTSPGCAPATDRVSPTAGVPHGARSGGRGLLPCADAIFVSGLSWPGRTRRNDSLTLPFSTSIR